MLDGTIGIFWSEVGQGTKFKTCIAIVRAPQTDPVPTSNIATIETPHDDPVHAVRNDYSG